MFRFVFTLLACFLIGYVLCVIGVRETADWSDMKRPTIPLVSETCLVCGEGFDSDSPPSIVMRDDLSEFVDGPVTKRIGDYEAPILAGFVHKQCRRKKR